MQYSAEVCILRSGQRNHLRGNSNSGKIKKTAAVSHVPALPNRSHAESPGHKKDIRPRKKDARRIYGVALQNQEGQPHGTGVHPPFHERAPRTVQNINVHVRVTFIKPACAPFRGWVMHDISPNSCKQHTWKRQKIQLN